MGRYISSLICSVVFSYLALANPIERRAISSSLLSTFNLYEQYAAAAYCPANNDSPATKLTCTSDACPLVEAADTDTIIEFQNGGITDTTGYLAVDTTNSLIVLSFRGSESLRNYLVDINFPLTAIDICTGCEGDSGFWQSWSDNRAAILPSVQSAVASNPSYTVVVTGHSLGGAIATFAATELRNSGITATLITFGSPRAVNPTGAAYINTQNKGPNYRITHLNDPVPALPPASFGFEHVDTEYYISSANGVAVTTADVQTCECNEDWVVFDIAAHAWYFNAISSCYDVDTIEV